MPMNSIEILHKFAEAYTTLMGLLVKENGALMQSTEQMLRNLSVNSSNDTRMDDINNGRLILSDNEYEDVERIFLTILQAVDEKYDNSAVLRLLDSTKQILSRFAIPQKKEQSITIKTMYDKVIMNSTIFDDVKLHIDKLKDLIYKR